jgi:hypothetical protein
MVRCYSIVLRQSKLRFLNILKWYGVKKSQYFKVLKFILKKIKVWYEQWSLEYKKNWNIIIKCLNDKNNFFSRTYAIISKKYKDYVI